jgi:hypothetical protein
MKAQLINILWDMRKAIPRDKFLVLDACIRKNTQKQSFKFPLRKLKKE